MNDSPHISVSIVEAIAERTERDVTELPQLYDCVDPDALESLVEGMSVGEVSFCYAGYHVTVLSDRSIHLEAQDQCGADRTPIVA